MPNRAFPILEHSIGHSLTLHLETGLPLWTYSYSGAPKPFFHPLRTPKGHIVTINEPHDHTWHRGLWFTLKYINSVNFWEEGPKHPGHGVQITLAPPRVEHDTNGNITISSDLEWANADGSIPIRENRTLTYHPLDAESYALDFDLKLHAQQDLELERTPYGTHGNYGGYAGLTLRGNRNWQQTRILFDDDSTSDRPLGYGSKWADLSGIFDGGPQQWGGIALLDHPENPRQPAPWYGTTGAGHYINAAFLFHEPMRLAVGETLRLRYRALIHDELFDATRLNAAHKTYLETTTP